MSITSPSDEHNGVAEWMEYWRGRREARLRELVTPAVVAEFRGDPHGAEGRSLALREALNYLRMQPIEDRVFVYAEVPFERYRLGLLRDGRGAPPEIDQATEYATENEAIAAVFERRLAMIGIEFEGAGEAR
jgi:hypothetical protein